MSIIEAVNRGNNPFIGGSRTPNAPPPALGGSIASANTNVSNPQGGVQPGQPFFARNNQGSNIGIPYTRLVPLGSDRIGLANPTEANEADHRGTLGSGSNGKKSDFINETEDLRATRIGFIHGRRSFDDDVRLPTSHNVNGFGVNPQTNPFPANANGPNQYMLAPGMVGTERFQKLCSLEYLQRYFKSFLSTRSIDLGALDSCHGVVEEDEDGNEVVSEVDVAEQQKRWWKSGILRKAKEATGASNVQAFLAFTQPRNALDTGDWTKAMALGGIEDGAYNADDPSTNSPAKNLPTIRQGIFACDTSPFLRGKGMLHYMTRCTQFATMPQTLTWEAADGTNATATVQPYSMNRCFGDEVAFDLLERALEDIGVTDWRPDGIVLSKGTNDPNDKLSDEYFDVRDGQLYNMRIQGPALTSTWTGDPALEMMPLDKVFIVIVADVWFGETKARVDGLDRTAEEGNMTEYERAKGDPVTKRYLPEFKRRAQQFFEMEEGMDDGKQHTTITNFRVTTATSSQMINYSPLTFDHSGAQKVGANVSSYRKVGGQSRMGLKLNQHAGEYIVGGWCIGNVLDTAASRAVFAGAGSNIGVRTAPNSMAINLNVQIEWWDADRMYRSFANKQDTNNTPQLTARYQRSQNDLLDDDGDPKYDPVNIPPIPDPNAYNTIPAHVGTSAAWELAAEEEEGEEEAVEEY